MVIFQYNLYIFGIHLCTVLYPKPCYNEPCYKEVVVYIYIYIYNCHHLYICHNYYSQRTCYGGVSTDNSGIIFSFYPIKTCGTY